MSKQLGIISGEGFRKSVVKSLNLLSLMINPFMIITEEYVFDAVSEERCYYSLSAEIIMMKVMLVLE